VLIFFWLLLDKEGLLMYGRHGVELFFAISGFILSTPFAMQALRGGKPVSLKKYFVRRVTRLEPPYILSLLIYFAFKMHFQPGQAHWTDLFCSTFYSSGLVLGQLPHVSTVTWSLEVEIQFYLLMPLLAMIYWIERRWIRRACFIALASASALFGPFYIKGIATGALYCGNVLTCLPYFLAGLMLADVYASEWRGNVPAVQKSVLAWGDAVWLVGWPLLLLVFMRDNLLTRLFAPALIFALDFSLFYSVWARKLMRVKWLTIIGGMCYSIYLMHNLVLEACLHVFARFLPHTYHAAMLELFLVSVVPVMVLCGAYYRFIEQPCMRPDWPQRFMSWLRAQAAAIRPQPAMVLQMKAMQPIRAGELQLSQTPV
jgi:peptidoglycan/LPS O-acetylase OafA/YrhL